MSQAEAIAALAVVDAGRTESVQRIKHGLTNESWLVRTIRDSYVVRLSNTAEDSLQINRSSEALVLDTVAAAGIGPEVVRCDPAQHVLITRHAGRTWTPAEAFAPANIDRIADVLWQLHGLRPPPGIQVVDLQAVVRSYLRTLDERGASGMAGTIEFRERAVEIAASMQSDTNVCLCHNDVHALNIVDSGGVDNGTLRLIDWEYAGIGQRLFDLASICVYHAYRREQREQLLRRYARSREIALWNRFELCCWLFDYVRDLWTAVRELQ